MSTKKMAAAVHAEKVGRMLSHRVSQVVKAEHPTTPKGRVGRADGGKVGMEGDKSGARLDRAPRAAGGRAPKGKTVVNINMAPAAPAAPAPVMAPRPVVAAPPPQMPVQRPPMAGPPPSAVPMGGGMPPGGGAPPPGAVPPPMMQRKAGGRVVMDAGAGGGLGRLEKMRKAKGGMAP